MRPWGFFCWSPGILTSILGCQPDLGDPASLVAEPRILAVRGDPPEARPGDPVSYRALVVNPGGAVESPPLSWAFCAAPRPLTENNAVSAACLGDAVRPLGDTPKDACALFGPDAPPGDFRPRDPDATGGFYQPVRVRSGGLTAFGLERITCNLPNAPVSVAIDLAARYHPNANPALTPLSATGAAGAAVSLEQVPRGAQLALEVGWGEGDAETYPALDLETQTLVSRREALRVSWFVTAGSLAAEVTGRGELETETTTSNTWTAPSAAGVTHLWIVLRDSRGGVDYARYDLRVEENP